MGYRLGRGWPGGTVGRATLGALAGSGGGQGALGDAAAARAGISYGLCEGVRADGRAYVLLDGASGVLMLPVAAELPLALLPSRRVVVAGDDAATWLVVGLTGASVLNVANGLAQLNASGDIADTLLSANVALLDRAQSWTALQTMLATSSATSALLRMQTANPVGSGTGNADLQFYDGDTLGFRFLASFGAAGAASRYGGFLAYTDRDGNRMSLQFFTTNSAGALQRALIVGSGAFAGRLGVGTSGNPDSVLEVNGAIATAFATKTAAYTLTATDSIIKADATAAAFTLTLPTAVGIAGRMYTVKRVNAGVNAVTVDAAGAQTIDGAATHVLSAQWQTVRLVSDGVGWLVV